MSEMRIGDAEREAAVKRLREHHAVGRLAPYEFADRMEAALKARTQSDLDPLFADLPQTSETPFGLEPLAPLPDSDATPAGRQRRIDWGDVAGWVSTFSWPAILIYLFVTDWRHWWLILLPAVLLPMMLQPKKGPHVRSAAKAERRRRAQERQGLR